MMRPIFNLYRSAYGGLSTASWMLALVIFINRSGSMVVPFLSVYLTSSLGYGLKEAGVIMSMYGLGSIVGGLGGGWLTDKIGHFKVQFSSLMISGVFFIVIAFLEGYYTLMVGIFTVSMIAESLRPANASSIAFYARPENLTRAFSLNRMAVNLGFSIGPALGGMIAAISFKLLFIADGITCAVAGILFFFYFRNKKGNKRAVSPEIAENIKSFKSPYKDRLYLAFILLTCLYATIFFQLFTTLPLYYKEVYELSPVVIGALLALNGAIVFGVEMILVYIIGNRFRYAGLITTGVLLAGVAFILLNAFHGVWLLVISMIVLSISEILAMPYMATLAVERSVEENRGSYMGLYTVSYSAAFIFAPLLGTRTVEYFNYEVLWWVVGCLSVITALFLYYVTTGMKKIQPN
jgi:MFS family permease